MSYHVHLHVCFNCDNHNTTGTAELAKKHLETIGNDCIAARWFLEDLATPVLSRPRPVWELSLWGAVFNYPNVPLFVETLKPFWEDLLSGAVEGSPGPYHHILVFYEEEQTEFANAYEIFWTNQWSKENRYLIIRHHERLPFTWVQY